MIKQTFFYAVLLVSALASPLGAQEGLRGGASMPPELDWTVDEPIVRAQIGAGMAKLRSGETPGPSVLTPIVTWISNTLDFPAHYDLPRVERTRIRLAAALHGSQFVSQHVILSNYDDTKQTIYLSNEWNGDTPEGMSVLIHEMVHHLQNVAATRHECTQSREKLAHVAQERWLAANGRSLEKDFGIDPLSYLVITECDIP